MKKDTFLSLIQQESCMDEEIHKIWDFAITVPENDKRWKLIYDESYSPHEARRQFCKYFELEFKEPVKRGKKDPVARWQKKLQDAERMLLQHPEHKELLEAEIRSIKKKIGTL